jgi:hypothetical protein
MVHARSELARKMSEKPTRVATDELQLHDRVNADAACPVQNHTRPVISADTADVPIPSTEPSSGIEATAPIARRVLACARSMAWRVCTVERGSAKWSRGSVIF